MMYKVFNELLTIHPQLNGADPVLKTPPSEYFVGKIKELVNQHGEQVQHQILLNLKSVVAAFVAELLNKQRP